LPDVVFGENGRKIIFLLFCNENDMKKQVGTSFSLQKASRNSFSFFFRRKCHQKMNRRIIFLEKGLTK